MKVFDWAKAARLIAERKPDVVYAGLGGDWDCTGGLIYCDGEPVTDSSGLYLASTWATPELDIDDDVIDCYVMQSDTEWAEDTVWPPEALEILNAANPG